MSMYELYAKSILANIVSCVSHSPLLSCVILFDLNFFSLGNNLQEAGNEGCVQLNLIFLYCEN
jgi:hypothetical protein